MGPHRLHNSPRILRCSRLSASGFTLFEMICTVAIVGIMVGMFYSVFLSNWSVMENYSARAYMWQDMDAVVDAVTADGREAARIDVSADQKTATFVDQENTPFVVYLLGADRRVIQRRAGVDRLLTNVLDFDNSLFLKRGRSVIVRLRFTDDVFDRGVSIETSTEIYPRN